MRQDQVRQLRVNSQLPMARSLAWRISQLEALKRFLIERNQEINEALWKDLRKSRFECEISEQGVVLGEINFVLKHLSRWMRPIRAKTPLIDQPGHCWIYPESLGVVLIIGAWNYPINLLLTPLVGALAAGNTAVLKPSELATATSALLARCLGDYLSKESVTVMEGGIKETQEILEIPFDSIFFTGSGKVGKIVMANAAQNLTPVTLELGGKSPAVVLANADLKVAARRIAWGKFLNAGQTCVAPDYVLIEASAEEKFIEELTHSIRDFFGHDPKQSPDYCRIVNDANFKRLLGLIDNGSTVCGGTSDPAERFIAPTVLRGVTQDMAIMQEEIFGPLLPLISIRDLETGIRFINDRPKPLALYFFSKDKEAHNKIVEETSSGGVCINDVIMQMPVPSLPFGGVGASGMGSYHGKRSFDTFTHYKSVMSKATWLDIPIRYAPYTDSKLKWIRRLF
jgi:aldehyde dehydrogenase (NAD+)